MRKLFIKWLGGYPDIDSAIQAIKEKDTAEKYQILTLAVKKLFNTIGAEDILRIDSATGQWFFQGKPLQKAEIDLLRAEATGLLDSKLWKVLQADVKWQSNKKMFALATTEMQIAAGKLWLYILDCWNTRMNSMRKGSALFNSQDSKNRH